ncbi:condensation domain-containing protein [Streptomyces sp. 1114.5]|uniref:condensation domain-containing protein n=1 Tax=Streptomyces sp. 1114.5 TaxID=1938830 RepID=UPI000EB28A55|nr:condensation domain-containing protein [Streptomyces sp. 1114.5]RKT08805.1 condensation domain-containing protein [Streptomyces sp. 1114.5]
MTAHDLIPPETALPGTVPPGTVPPEDAPYEEAPLAGRPPARRVTVRFAAASSGVGPLTRGQDNMLRCIRGEAPEQINREASWPVPAGTSVPAGLVALRLLVERHESLRTSFPAGPGPDGFPDRQVVHADGRFAVTVVEAGEPGEVSSEGEPGSPDGPDERELDALAAELGRSDVAVPVDPAAPPRIRFTMVARGERLLRLVAVVCHAGADGAATAVLIQEWHALAAGKELPPVTAPTPLLIAAAEQSAQGRRKATAALRHWAKILDTGPQTVFADSRITGPARDHAALLVRSRGAADHLAAVCRRTGAGPSVVLLAAFAALVAHRADRGELVISALSANRQRTALADHVGTLAQDALILLDTRTADFDQLIGRAKSASLSAYWHSTLDAGDVWQLIEDVAHRRGTRFARQVVVNDLSLTIPPAVADAQPPPAADPELTPLPAPPLAVRLMFTILRITGSLGFVLIACPQVLDPEENEHFARTLLALLADAAEGPVPLAGLPAVLGLAKAVPDGGHADGRTGQWRLIDGSRVDLAAVHELLEGTLGPHRLSLVDGSLVADLTTADPEFDPAAAHRAVVAALPGRDTAMAPHRYVVRQVTPDGVRTVAGSGRDPEIVARLSALT